MKLLATPDMDTHDCEIVNAGIAELLEALGECREREYNVQALRDIANRFVGTNQIIGRDKEFAAQVLCDYARAIRVATAALAKWGQP